jgi:hypothetical protein
MSVATPNATVTADFDRDGQLEWTLTGVSGELSVPEARTGGIASSPLALYRLENRTIHEHDALPVTPEPAWWGSACSADFDNDGAADLLMAPSAPWHFDESSESSTDTLLRQFARSQARLRLSSGSLLVVELGRSVRGLACFDYDQDGDIDVFAVSARDGLTLLENKTNHPKVRARNWLQVSLEGPHRNTSAIGARLILHTTSGEQHQIVQANQGFLGQTSYRVHFGIRSSDRVTRLEVIWPDARQHRTIVDAPPTGELLSIAYRGTEDTRGRAVSVDRELPRRIREAISTVRLTDVTQSVGLQLPIEATESTPHMQPYFTGGVAVGDFNADGWPDLYLTRGARGDRLFANDGSGSFTDVTERHFGASHLEKVFTSGSLWCDVDNDGDLDLYVTSLFTKRFHLFINEANTGSNARFVEQGIQRGAAIEHPSWHFGASVTCADYDQDGDLDLHTTEWRSRTQVTGAPGPGHARLLNNDGRGFFTDVTQASGVSLDGYPASSADTLLQAFTSQFADLNNDGLLDLAIASDHGTSRLFWNNGDGSFRDGSRSATIGSDQFGMGSAIADYDRDGDLDWFVSSIFRPGTSTHSGNRMYRNDGNGRFEETSIGAHVRDAGWGWGAVFADIDNDGYLDLAVVNGFDAPMEFFPPEMGQRHSGDINRLWINDGNGRFHDASATSGFGLPANARGLASLDFDRDGDQDLVVANNDGTIALFRNDTARGHSFLQLKLIDSEHGRAAVGAWVRLEPDGDSRAQAAYLSAGGQYLSQSESIVHFGLGPGTRFVRRITIRWPNGTETELTNVAADQRIEVLSPIGRSRN